MYQLCFGGILTISTLIPFLIVHTSARTAAAEETTKHTGLNICCNLATFLAYTGWIVILSVLFCKTYRAYQVTRIRRLQSVGWSLIGSYTAVMLVTVGVLLGWILGFPAEYRTYQYSSSTSTATPRYEETQGCSLNNFAADRAFYATMFVISSVLYLGVLVLAWKVRDTSPIIGESQRIFRLLLFLWIYAELAGAFVLIVSQLQILHDENADKNEDDGDDDNDNDTNTTILLTGPVLMQLKRLSALFYYVQQFVIATLPVCVLILPRVYYVGYEYRYGHLPPHVMAQLPGGRVHVSIVGGTTTTTTSLSRPATRVPE